MPSAPNTRCNEFNARVTRAVTRTVCQAVFGVVLGLLVVAPGAKAEEQVFIERDMFVLDLIQNVEWLRCSLGQVWDGETCQGEVMKLNHDEIAQAILQANEQLGGAWRLPTSGELKNIVCKSCNPPKIDLQIFPATSAEPYWTGEANPHRKPNIYSINFYTGHKYGNFFPYQRLAVRLVRDR
jgi:hypothetical protein